VFRSRACLEEKQESHILPGTLLPNSIFFCIFLPIMKTMRCIISGLVQGVGYRYFVLQRARALALRGYVRNDYTGSVEVVAQGEDGMLQDLLGELRVGPRSAQVRGVRVEWTDEAEMYHNFEIRI
jgi:acylphosphatase